MIERKEEKQLKIFLVSLGILVLIVLGVIFFLKGDKTFEQKGVTFNVVNEIAPYQTSLPVFVNGESSTYNFYLRKDPRKTADKTSGPLRRPSP